MDDFKTEEARIFYSEIYDTVVSDWSDEVDFYQDLTNELVPENEAVLELACGTGRISLRLAEKGFNVVGLDSSPAMIKIAQSKSQGLPNIQWIEADMRTYELGKTFPLVIVPAHSFQNLTSVDDHLAALNSIYNHLSPNGTLIIHVDHLEHGWLGGLIEGEGGMFKPAGSFVHPITNQQIQATHAWSYDPVMQTATGETVWETTDEKGAILNRLESGALQYHCFFRFEMEHLFLRCGFEIVDLYGDFNRGKLKATSSEMIWVVKK